MPCIKFDVTINGDVDGKLANIVSSIAGTDSVKLDLLAAYVSSAELLDYLKQDDVIIHQVGDSTSIRSVLDSRINTNTLKRVIKEFYNQKRLAIKNHIVARNIGALNGFKSATAIQEALDYNSVIIESLYSGNLLLPKSERLNRIQIIKEASGQIIDRFLNNYVLPLLSETKELKSDKAKELSKNLEDAINEVKTSKDVYYKLIKRYKTADKESKATLKSQIEEIKEQFENAKNKRYIAAINLVEEFGTDRTKNFSALVQNIKSSPNEWYKKVFQSSRLVNISKDFESSIESGKLVETNAEDELDIDNPNSENVDEMSKSWEDKLYKSFDKAVDTDIKLYLNTLFKLSAPSKLGDENYNYDTNNELGVPTTMGANFIIQQLSTQANYASVTDFIKSVYKLSQEVPELYGLVQIVNKMVNDYSFASRIFTQLANPQVMKTMITLGEYGINIDRSNKSGNKVAYTYYQMLNTAKSRYRDVFDVRDKETVVKSISNINKEIPDLFKSNVEIREKYNNIIDNITFKYFPKVEIRAIRNYINSDINKYKEVLNQLLNVINAADSIIDDYNKKNTEYRKQLSDYKKRKRASEEAGILFKEIPPVFDQSSIRYDKFDAPCIELAKAFSQYSAVKTELNTINAEGNQASDLIKNNFITNLFKQINYGTEEDANKGLNLLKDYIVKGEQYRYEPLFFGVSDSNGKLIIPGLFIRKTNGDVVINPDAKKILSYSLFDGAKDFDNTKSAMYNNMSKADYFMSQLIAFENPIRTEELLGDSSIKINSFGGFFMRTPSDAPKNFIFQAPKYTFEGLFNPIKESIDKYIDTIKQTFANKLNFNPSDTELNLSDKLAFDSNKNNQINANDVYEILTEGLKGNLDNIVYNNKTFSYNSSTNEVIIPLEYRNKEERLVIFVKGNKVKDGESNIIENVTISSVLSDIGTIPQSIFDANIDTIKDIGIKKGFINVNINEHNPIFRGFRTHLLGELNTYIDQLNNLFKVDNDGVYRLRKDTTGLIDIAHYKKELVKDGKLTGKFFKFEKLFNTNGYDTNKAMESSLYLYGVGDNTLFKSDRKGMFININRDDLITIKNNRLTLNISNTLNTVLDNITKEWIKNFNIEINNRTEEFKNILEANNKSSNEVTAYLMNAALMNMNFDAVFEGSSKFYKDARTFLKRTKEVQAGGKVYSGFDINDGISQGLHDIKDFNGEEIIIGTAESPYLLPHKDSDGKLQLPESASKTYRKARNGFKAITIYNTVRPSKRAQQIHDEVYDYISKSVSSEQAEKIAANIAKGYREATITNDAQSYITIDEFIARRYADGTIEEYRDILNQLQEVREGKKEIKDIDLSNINARIQVQKNFYYDHVFDDSTRTYYPRQIKNAEFVLIPELIKGTDLEKLYNIMKENGIDQINTAETSKAAKKNVLTFWDNDGNVNENFDTDIKANNNAAIEDFYYRYLYKQQDVPQHLMDEENKAGIQIMKKILDNANDEVKPYINDFFKAYCANISNDFHTLMNNMGWKVKDRRIVNIDETKEQLDFTEFYKKARAEAQRLGMDSNFAEYLTPDPSTGLPIMPNFMNNVSTKLESIAQSIFNSGITRQTLPGWHAAQITSVGHGRGVLDSDGKLRQLEYHPQVIDENGNVVQEAYAEVLVPRWSNLIGKDVTIEQLEKEGLDMQIAYRIPTEGKQSVSVVKVVGFLNDVYGSTIMVPDEWVTQTGSDFDVDSIYAICYRMYKDKNGNVHKIKYDYDKSESGIIRRYERYVSDNIKDKIDRTIISDEFIKNKFDEIYDELNGERYRNNSTIWKLQTNNASELFKSLPNKYKQAISTASKLFTTKDKLIEKYDSIIETVDSIIKTESNEEIKTNLDDYKDAIYSLRGIVAKQRGLEKDTNFIEEFRNAKSEALKDIFAKADEEYFDAIQTKAKEVGLMSYDEFSNLDIIEQQSRAARDNIILDSMISIMNNINSREENYSRSNFDDLTDAMTLCDERRGALSASESAYNPFDQINFMENAMSGAQLKAFSVTRDTFNSVNNYCKSTLGEGHEIFIEYDLNKYNKDTLISAFGRENISIDEQTNTALVKHTRIGNSLNNRNAVGKLLTPYSSQTTAHILDAVKKGSIFNENDYTFGTFKTLVDVGTDYDTAVAFLMQPAITRINNAYYSSKSIYIKSGGNPTDTAVRNIAKELKLTIAGKEITDYTPMTEVWTLLNNNEHIQNAFRVLFKTEINGVNGIEKQSSYLNGEMLLNRLDESNIFNSPELSNIDKQYIKAAFDLNTIISFKNIYNTTKNIEQLARCANPDRFGAKQTVKETRDKLEDIKNFIFNEKNEVANTIMVGDKNIIQALYPGFGTNEGININDSKYPYLAAFLKYATIPSVECNKQLFTLESDTFYNAIRYAESKLGCKFTPELTKEYNQYLVASSYIATPFFTTPQTISKDGYVIDDIERIKEYADNDTFYWKSERARIFGYDTTVSSNLEIKNINHPTDEEMSLFNKMTPAQKVLWIQANFKYGKGIFGLLDVNTFNQYEYKNKGYTSQVIKFNDSVDNIEEVYRAFRESFFNSNPLIKASAIDLIKYAFIVEGFRFKKNGISKLITNDALYSHKSNFGIDIIQNVDGVGTQLGVTINEALSNLSSFTGEDYQAFITNFVRSHSDIVKELRLNSSSSNVFGKENLASQWNKYIIGDNMLFIPYNKSTIDILSAIGNKENDVAPKGFIKVNKYINKGQRKVTLYKIRRVDNGVYLIPLNLLERNETSDYSVNNKNNNYFAEEYYNSVIDFAEQNNISAQEVIMDKAGKYKVAESRNKFTIKPHKNKYVVESAENPNEFININNSYTGVRKAEVSQFINDIAAYVSSPVEERGKYGVVRNTSKTIANLIPFKTTVIQNIPIGNEIVPVKISRDYNKQAFKYISAALTKGTISNINVPKEYVNAVERSIKAHDVPSGVSYYKIEQLTDEEAKDFADNARLATTDDITISNNDLEFTKVDQTAKNIYEALNTENKRNRNDADASHFIKMMNIKGLNPYSSRSIQENKSNIYSESAKYYTGLAHNILDKMNNIKTDDGQKFDITNPDLYKYMLDHEELYPKVLKLILDAKTFGGAFYDIFNLNLDGEDVETQKAIKAIRDAINTVRHSDKLERAIDLIFNNFLANKLSTNPLVREGIVNVREAFKDTDWFDLTFSDIAEIDNKQIQIAVKYAYQVLYEATTIEAPEAVKEFERQYDEIMNLAGDFDINHIVTPEGKLISEYTDKFIEDKKKLTEVVKEAKDKYGEDSIEYYRAKLARDKFRAKNIHQEVNTNYYNELNTITENVLNRAGKEYVEYMKLIHQLYKDNLTQSKLTPEEVNEKKTILRKISQLLSDVDASDKIKSDEQLERIEVLRNYIKAKKVINNKYFDYNESENFKSTLEYYKKIINNYENAHPNETLDMRLANNGFADAYNWIKTNTVYKLSDEANKKVYNAFNILRDEDNPNSKSKFIKSIISKANAYDEYGNIDPRKLSADDIKKIREATINKYTRDYDSNAGEAILIKDIPAGLPVLKNSFYRLLRGEGESAQNPLRLVTIKRINELLSKVIGRNGKISVADLFTNLTKEERQELATCYLRLRNIKSNRTKEQKNILKKNVKFETNNEAFNEAFVYGQTQLKGTKEYTELLNIIVQTDKDGVYVTDDDGHFVPNSDIYGYIVPKDKTYIDEEKTAARNLIENDLRFVPTEYYYEASRQATKDGRFDEWFNDNHVYNPYTHKMEPLAVWTSMEVNPNGNLAGEYSYNPTYDNVERTVKDDMRNDNYNPEDSVNYNIDTGDYNNRTKLSNKERQILNLFQSTINHYATSYGSRRFARQGFMPRRAKYTPDARWYSKQLLGAAGIEWRNTKESKWTDQVDYLHDHDINFDMMQLLKAKGYIDIANKYPKPIRMTDETDDAFNNRMEEYKKNVAEAEANNLKLDNAILDRDWKSVMLDFVAKGVEHQAREKIKNPLYLLLEDLKSNSAYKTSIITGKVKENKRLSTDENTVYQEVPQSNSFAIAQNWIRRIIYNEYKKDSALKNWADMMQNMTSAKYMIFNVTGGIANVGTGIANIMNEVFAGEYFNNNQYLSAKRQYFNHSVSMIKDLYNPKATSFESGLIKFFNVVDFDAFNERRSNETATEYVKRTRDFLYSMQSGGEHYMQNTILFAMLKSNRLYTDTDGKQKVGTLADYIWKIEQETLIRLIDNREDLQLHYDAFIKNIKSDKTMLRKYDNFSRDFNADFLREVGDKNLIKEYIAERDKAVKKAKKEFNNDSKHSTLESQLELIDGQIQIKSGSPITGNMIADFRNRVIEVNKKIHGVYDKLGAAKIESEWWGGLVMQYHKHIYPGIMRRWRTNGYYNEQRGSMERGSYISLAKFLTTDFDGIINRIKSRQADNNENIALASIQEIVKSCIDTVINFNENWQLLPEWERRNIKRNLGDLYGIMSALFMSMCIYMMSDDDDLKESELLATSLYMTDRLLSEAQMYTPWGLSTEAKTMWSSPIAVMNTPQDLIQCAGWAIKLLYDDDFDPNYTTGLYKGQNRFAVKLKRNIPIMRVYERLNNMTKNNSYYRIDDNALNLKVAKNIADSINPD